MNLMPGFSLIGFNPDPERMPPLPDLADESGWRDYKAAEQQQIEHVKEADLAAAAQDLIEAVAEHWAYGVYATQSLAELAREKQRRLIADGVPRGEANAALAAWFAGLGIESYVPDAHDCGELMRDEGPHAGDDGVGRPGFYDNND